MAKRISAFEFNNDGYKTTRPGIHAKTKSSKHKASKLYKKAYRGQGK